MYSSLNSGREHSNGAAGDTRLRGRNREMVVEWQNEGEKNEVLNRKTTCYLTHDMWIDLEPSKQLSIEYTQYSEQY